MFWDLTNRNKQSHIRVVGSSIFDAMKYSLNLKDRVRISSRELDNLTSSYSSEKERIERYICHTADNRSYTRPKYQIEQEKFETRIEVYPKDWCRVS